LDPKNLVKAGTLKYNKSRKPVYNGKTYTSTKALQKYLQSDEGIQEAAQTNTRINDAINQSATFAQTEQQGGQPVSQTISPGQAATEVVGASAVEGTETSQPSQPTPQGKKEQKVQPETSGGVKPRVKGDSQAVVEAFEKAIAAGKKVTFPVSGGRTTVQLDKPGQLKANEEGDLYIDRGKGKREYLPAGGGEESVIRQQLGVAETAESKQQRKKAKEEGNKKRKEKEETQRKDAEAKQIQKKKEYVARLQKVLDSGKDEKGNPINARQRKEAQSTIDRLNADIAAAEGKPTEKKTETKPAEGQKPSTETSAGMPKDIQEAYAKRANLRMIADALQRQMKGKPLVGKSAKELANVEAEIEVLDKKIDAYEKSKETKTEVKPEPKQETKSETAPEQTELVGETEEGKAYGNFLLEKIMGKDFPFKATRAEFIKSWNSIAKDKSDSKANNLFEEILVGIASDKEKPSVIYNLREEFKNQAKPSTIIGSDVDGKGEPKKYAYQYTLAELVDKAKNAVADGVFKVNISKHGKYVTATLFNAVENLQQSTFPAPTDIKGDLTNYATPILARELHETSVKNAITPQMGQAVSAFQKAINEGRMSAEAAKEIILSANQPLPDWLKQQLPAEEVAATTVAEQTPAIEAAQELVENLPAEKYKPLTSKNIEIGKFSKDEALDYETDEKELESGRMSEYISSMTVDVMDEDGNSIGNLIRLKDEDGIATYQATDVDGNELAKESFDTKQEAIDAILAAHNKAQEKEFNKQQKKTEKERQKAESKQKPEMVNPTQMTTSEPQAAQMFSDADAIMDAEKEKRMSKAKQLRENFIATHGKETFDKINKITRNFEKIISDLEKDGKCTKKC